MVSGAAPEVRAPTALQQKTRRKAAFVGREPKYLLSGLLRCAICGGGLEARSRSHGGQRKVFYGCSAYHRRGTSVCTNSLTVPMEVANDKVVEALKASLLNPRVLETAIHRAVAAIRDREQRRQLLTANLKIVERGSPADDQTAVLADLHSRLTEWRALLHDETQRRAGC